MRGHEPAYPKGMNEGITVRLELAGRIAAQLAAQYVIISEPREKVRNIVCNESLALADELIRLDRESCKTRLHGQPPVTLDQATLDHERERDNL